MRWHTYLVTTGAALLAACGASRSTRSSNCSNLNAMTDPTIAAGKLENYDPSAVLLIFKATADKISIESRCNARLMHKLNTYHKLPSGERKEAATPVNFSQLQLEVEGGGQKLELHTSAHCFYRVWDSRVRNQVLNNAAIGIEPVRSLLKDMKTRYQLYRSMLTSPQTLVAYAADGTPLTFSYKTPVTAMYERFFADVDKLNSPATQQVVGREFSKTSVFLDEQVLDVCNSDEKLKERLANEFPEIKSIDDENKLFGFLARLKSGEFRDRKSRLVLELFRTKSLNTGRHKLCFSQQDMVIVPIQLSSSADAAQKKHLSDIEIFQKNKAAGFVAHLNGQGPKHFIPEITPNTQPFPTPQGAATCSFAPAYPGFSFTDVFAQAMNKKYAPSWVYKPSMTPGFVDVFKFVFPNMRPTNEQTSSSSVYEILMELALQETKCKLKGLKFDDDEQKCVPQDKNEVGVCPAPPATSDPATVNLANTKAQNDHESIKASLRLASVSPLLVMKRMRESAALALSMPMATLRDYNRNFCDIEKSDQCTDNGQSGKILDAMLNTFTSVADGRNVDIVAINDYVVVEELDSDLQFKCAFKIKPAITADNFAHLERNLSPEAKAIIFGSDETAQTGMFYNNLIARLNYLNCIPAGMGRLYNGYREFAGLLQGLSFSDVSFVKSELQAATKKLTLSNREMIESGAPVGIPFASLFINPSEQPDHPGELAARMMGSGHVEISFCTANGASSKRGYCAPLTDPVNSPTAERLTQDLALMKAHLNFTAQVPNWLPDSEKAKYGAVAFPQDHYSPYSARYFLGAGDSGTTVSAFGLWPIFMLSTVQDRPVSGGLAVIPSTGGQEVQSSKNSTCR